MLVGSDKGVSLIAPLCIFCHALIIIVHACYIWVGLLNCFPPREDCIVFLCTIILNVKNPRDDLVFASTCYSPEDLSKVPGTKSPVNPATDESTNFSGTSSMHKHMADTQTHKYK